MNKVRISTETDNIKNYQTESIEIKNKITELKNSIERFNSRLDQVEERVSKLEDRAVEYIHSVKQNEIETKNTRDQ